jgi:hypothetical protein
MVKDTCLIALKRKDRSPHILHLEILVDLLLKVFVHRLQNNSLNAQAYNNINATIICIGMIEEKADMILRILEQESADSELWLKRYGVLKFRGLYMNLEGSMGFFRKLPGLW